MLLAGIIWIVFRARLNTLRKKATEAETRLILDKKVSDLEHQALRLQMNPHFIFNALNSIQSQIGDQNEQRARYYLAKFGRLMRQILDNSRKQFISLKEEVETLENYLLVEKFSSGDTFEYEIVTDDKMDMDFIKIPPMLLQPFVENSIKHGFKNLKARRGKIQVEFKEWNHKLICTITDNGVGREIAQERAASEGESYHESTALKVIRERLMLMDQGNAEPNINILDLHDENGKPCGTKITVEIPIS
jgi:LytS/YehU family sensor histidine kinase